MNIVPNATLIVQMVHVGVAYQVIKRFLCKPIIEQLDAQAYERETILQAIQANNQHIDHLAEQRQKQWQAAHAFFVAQMPILSYQHDQAPSELSTFFTYPSNQQVEILVSDISQAVLQRVTDYGK